MKSFLACISLVFIIGLSLCAGAMSLEHQWEGVDEAVVERFAADSGRQAKPGFIEASGDLILLLFLIAGAAGGFVAGYCFRQMFPPQRRTDHESER